MIRNQNDPAADPQRVTGVADLLASVPALLGFHPHDSLVLVGLRGTRLVVTARTDLDDASASLLRDTLRSMQVAGVNRIVAALYTDQPHRLRHRHRHREHGGHGGADVPSEGGALPCRGIVERVAHLATAAGIEVLDCLLVAGTRWWTYPRPGHPNCPGGGGTLPTGPSAAHARAVYGGVQIASDRTALGERFSPEPASERLQPLIARARQLHTANADTLHATDSRLTRAVLDAARAHPAARAPLTDDELVRLALALSVMTVRDAVWLAVDDRLPDAGLWDELARRLPAPHSAAPLFLAGWRAWRDGNGALTAIAVGLCLQADPAYRAAHLLRDALTAGIDPNTVPTLRIPGTPTRI